MIIIEYPENTPSQPEKPARQAPSLEDGMEGPGLLAHGLRTLARFCRWTADRFLERLGLRPHPASRLEK